MESCTRTLSCPGKSSASSTDSKTVTEEKEIVQHILLNLPKKKNLNIPNHATGRQAVPERVSQAVPTAVRRHVDDVQQMQPGARRSVGVQHPVPQPPGLYH